MAEKITAEQKTIIDGLLTKLRAFSINRILLFYADTCLFLEKLQRDNSALPGSLQLYSGDLLAEYWAVITKRSKYDSEPLFLLHQLLLQLHVDIAKVVDAPFEKDSQQHPLLLRAIEINDSSLSDLLEQIGKIFMGPYLKNISGFTEKGKSVEGFLEVIQKPTTDDKVEWLGALAFTVEKFTILIMIPWLKYKVDEIQRPFAIYSKEQIEAEKVKSFLDSFIQAFAEK